MLTQILDLALDRFGLLRSKVDELISMDVLKFLKSIWVKYKGSYNPYIKKPSLAGIDSGYNYIEYRGYALYVVSTVSVLLNENREENLDGWVNVDIVSSPNLEYELSILSTCAEVKFMEKLVSKVDLVLVDGSLVAILYKLHKASLDAGLEVLENNGINVAQLLKDLIIMLSINPKKFIFISKNSNSRDLLGLVKGDIYYLERYTDFEVGYSKPIDLVYSKNLGVATVAKLFNKYSKRATGLDLTIGLTYTRFDKFSRVYRIEIVVEPNEDIDARIKHLIDVLSDVIISGYPYPLARAHNLAKVSSKDVERVAILLGIAKDPRDREAFLM
ncbi:MAG: DNA double-strand break repair nuclease NurA [Ignisphaera sp.]|uniref:DNA double-strand break repair nuclease NurA n=1 Tax=Ignisphaera aggregans TaxID=334771 RepID=A0A7C4JJT3_9CREN